MKKINYIKFVLLGFTAMALSSCLKDKTYINFADGGQSAELPLSGLNSFAQDAILSDTAVISFGVNIASSSTPTADHKITVDVIPSKVAEYVATNKTIAYELMPESVYTFKTTVVDIPGGQRLKVLTFTVYKNKLDPSKSYMLPIGITSAPGLTISANNALHYYHVIGNDFAGTYTWDYKRWNNGTGPGVTPPFVPTDAGTTLGQVGRILPVSATEFQMETGYNGNGVLYNVTFDRTVNGSVITYSNWAVRFTADNLKIWTDAGITNMTPPAFTVPPPATNADPKVFEINYVSGGAAGRYIDDTYKK
jgi:hypothetical protein